MARQKPLSRKARRDLNSIAIREDYNRANQLRRDKDEIKNISNSIIDMDGAIMYYFNEVIKPTVTENKETVRPNGEVDRESSELLIYNNYN